MDQAVLHQCMFGVGVRIHRGNRRSDFRGVGKPFGDVTLGEADGDIGGKRPVAVEIDDRRFHALQGGDAALAESPVRIGQERVSRQAWSLPVINERRKLRGDERFPREHGAIAALEGRERAPFVNGQMAGGRLRQHGQRGRRGDGEDECQMLYFHIAHDGLHSGTNCQLPVNEL